MEELPDLKPDLQISIAQGPYNSGKTWKTQGIFFTQGKPGKLREFQIFFFDSGKTRGIL